MANPNLQQPISSWPNTRTPEGSTSVIERTERAAEQVADSAIEQVRSARSGLSEQRGQIAERIRRVGTAMRESGDRVRNEDEMAADYLRMASQRIDRVASYVTTADLSVMAADTQEFIRKRPAVFFGGAFLVGLAAGRFLKASGGANKPSSASRPADSYGSRPSGDKRLPSEGTPTSTTSSSSSPVRSAGATSVSTSTPSTGVRWSAPAQSPGGSPAKPPANAYGNGDNPNSGSRSRLP
jgi:hypothetical protein